MYYRVRLSKGKDTTLYVSQDLRTIICELDSLIHNCKENNINYKDKYVIEDENNEIIYVS